jgi:hypothetical protein
MTGGRFALLKEAQKLTPEKVIQRYMLENPSHNYLLLMNIMCYTGCIDKKITDKILGPLEPSQWWELSQFSFIQSTQHGYRLDALLKRLLAAEANKPLSPKVSKELSSYLIDSIYEAKGLIFDKMTALLRLHRADRLLPEELLHEDAPFQWTAADGYCDGFLPSNPKDISNLQYSTIDNTPAVSQCRLSVYILKDPCCHTVGFLTLAEATDDNLYMVAGVGIHPLIEKKAVCSIARKIMKLCIEGISISVPMSFQKLCAVLSRFSFPKKDFKLSIYKGKALLCEPASLGVTSLIADMPRSIGLRSGQRDGGAAVEAKHVRAALRLYHDTIKLQKTVLFKNLKNKARQCGNVHFCAEDLRQLIKNSIQGLTGDESGIIAMAYIKSQTRESMADILGVSPRTIYRRLNHILNTLAADIAEAATDHERTGLLHANDRTAHYKHTAK